MTTYATLISHLTAGRAQMGTSLAFHLTFAVLGGALVTASAVCAAGGVWLAAAPWALGYATAGALAWEGDLLPGAALASISMMAVRAAHYTAS